MSVFRYLGRRHRKASSCGRSPRPMRLAFETLESRALVTADLLTSVPLAVATTGGTNSTPAVAAQTSTANADPTTSINYSLVLTDASDNPITGPLIVGETFFIDVYIDDTRSVSNAGAISAATDVSFDSTVMTPASSTPVIASSIYPSPTSAPHGSYNASTNPNRITNVNGTVPLSTSLPTPPGNGPQLLDRIQMTAAAATASTTISTSIPQSDPTDNNSVFLGNDGNGNSGTTAAGSQIGQGSVTTQILSPASASLTGGSATAGATATSIQFTASLSAPVDVPVTIHYATANGTATAGTDYTGVSDGTVQLAANQQSATFSINVAADANSHASRTFNVAITSIDVSPTGLVTPDPNASQATGTIDFSPPNVTISDASVQSGASATTISFPVHLSGTSDVPVVLDYSTVTNVGDSAIAGTDYTQEVDQKLTIPANTTDATIQIPILAHSVSFIGSKTFHVNVGVDSTDTSGAHLTNTSAQGSITSATPNLSIADATAQASSAATTISFPIHLSNASNQPVVLDYSTVTNTGDTAVAGTDYTQQTNQVLTIPANTTDATIQIPIAAQAASFIGSKTFHVSISLDAADTSGVLLANTSAQGSITSVAPNLSIGNATVQGTSTAGMISFPVHLSEASTQPVVLDYSTADGTAVAGTDYTQKTNQVLTIPANTTDATIQIPIAAQSTPFSATKTFHVNISVDSADTSGVHLTNTSAVGSITSPAPTLSISDAAVQGGTSATTISFPVHLNGASSQPVVLDYSTADGTAVAGTDYTQQTNQKLTIQAGKTDATITISILAQPAQFSGSKTFHVNISLDSNDTSGVQLGTTSAQGTITSAAPSVSIADATVQGSSTATMISFPVHLSGASNQPVVLDYSTATNTGDTAVAGTDYTQTAQTITIPAGTTDTTIQIPISAQLAQFAGGKTFHVNVSLNKNDNSGVSLTNTSALGSITSPTPGLSISDATAQASPSVTTISFPVHLTVTADQPVVLDYSTADGTAVAGTDYTQQTNQQVTIPANTSDATIQIPILAQSAQFSGSKTFHVNISLDSTDHSGAELGTTSAQGTITSAPAAAFPNPGSVTPTQSVPTTMSFDVHLQNQQGFDSRATQDVTIQYRVYSDSGDTAVGGSSITASGVDYLAIDTTAANPLGQPLVIPAGQTTGSINVPIAAELAGTGSKTFHIQILSVSQGAFVSSVASTTTGTINLNQIPKPLASIQNSSLPEPTTPQNMQFTVNLSAPSTVPVTVNYTITPGTALANVDYTPPATQGTVTIPAHANFGDDLGTDPAGCQRRAECAIPGHHFHAVGEYRFDDQPPRGNGHGHDPDRWKLRGLRLCRHQQRRRAGSRRACPGRSDRDHHGDVLDRPGRTVQHKVGRRWHVQLFDDSAGDLYRVADTPLRLCSGHVNCWRRNSDQRQQSIDIYHHVGRHTGQ